MREILTRERQKFDCTVKNGELFVCTEPFSDLLLKQGTCRQEQFGTKCFRTRSLTGLFEFSILLVTERVNLSSGKIRFALEKKWQGGSSGILIEDGVLVAPMGVEKCEGKVDEFMNEMINGFSSQRFRKLLEERR